MQSSPTQKVYKRNLFRGCRYSRSCHPAGNIAVNMQNYKQGGKQGKTVENGKYFEIPKATI
jgi:hypothetical protein